MSEPSPELIDRIIHDICETHDTTDPKNGIWAHVRRDHEAFRSAVKYSFKIEAMRLAKTAPIVDQPAPTASKFTSSWELVILDFTKLFNAGQKASPVDARAKEICELLLEDMKERDRVGRERYGVPLQAGNGRRHLVDAYQELLDELVYLRTWLEEKGVVVFSDDPPAEQHVQMVLVMYFEAIQRAGLMRDLIEFGL